jgi:hypothetical protein
MRYLLIPLAIGVLLSACRDDDPVAEPEVPATKAPVVRLTVAPMWNGAPFDKNTTYTNISDERIQVQLLKFYLGDLALVNGTGDTASLVDVDLFQLTNGPVVHTYKAEQGAFSALHVGLGVPAALNGESPTMWANDEPLSITNGMYWTWATMYRFMIFEGRFDTLATNTGTPPFQFSIHTGRNECYRTTDLALPLTLGEGDTADVRLELDLARFFYSATDTLYMDIESQQHGAVEELPMSQKFSGMVIDAMSIAP